RGVTMLPVSDQVPVCGSYSSAELVTNAVPQQPPDVPPATSTLPFGSSTAVAPDLDTNMLPVLLHVPVAGSYNSAVASVWSGGLISPPATSTLPFGSNTAMCARRAPIRFAVGAHVPVNGLYSSADANVPPEEEWPPT